ncbi:MAG: cytidine deaminase [Erysipelotrichaceae bacterium]
MKKKELIEVAFEAMKNAYAPYSKFHVGAAVLLKDGKVLPGVNVENASYGLTNCGERTAIFSAYALGYRKEDIEALAIVCDGEKIASPCGACRQVLVELLLPDTPIYLANKKSFKETTIAALLPDAFLAEDLNG